MCFKLSKKIDTTTGFKYDGKLYPSRYEAAYAKMQDGVRELFPYRTQDYTYNMYPASKYPDGYQAKEIAQMIDSIAAVYKQFQEDCKEPK